MSITSFYFLCFYALVLILYYTVPLIFNKKGQWVVLLCASVFFYIKSGNPVLVAYPVFSAALTCFLLRLLGKTDQKELTRRRIILGAEVAVLLGILIVLKYLKLITGSGMLVPLGLSFYTFIILGYFIEVYNGIGKAQTSFFKTALYGLYFPVLISGPIFKTRESGDQFFEYHPLDYKNITYGFQRMLWGFFKELVISERLAVVVNTIFNDDTSYPGTYIWIGGILFALQLYTNFSGCMDIVIGLSETFGIILPENFRTPFFAKNISEYWRRWHITLGIWMKDNVFYPLLRTKLITGIGKSLKGKMGKKKGKQYTTYIAMFVLWFSVGLWHGGEAKYVIGSGLLHWFYIVFGELTLPFFTWLFGEKLHIDLKGKFADTVRIIRTFLLVCIGDIFFRADSVGHALRMLREGVTVFNPGILVDGSLLNLGINIYDWGIIAFSLGILLWASVIQYRLEMKKSSAGKEAADKAPENIRDILASKNIVIRWVFLFAALFFVILVSEYGPGYSAAEFIYKDF
jgi:D-alanyl-lipoteichoic acid acyltransferase DltB (MBOAT superfamily)